MKRTCLTVLSAWVLLISSPMVWAQEDGGGATTPVRAAGADALPPQLNKALTLWEDYIHYLRIAQLDLAARSGTEFDQLELTPAQLLNLIDEVSIYRDYGETLKRAQRMDGPVSAQARKIADKIRDARFALAREEKRVRAAIEELAGPLRSRLNAQQRLQRAGEYATPQMLKVLLSTEKQDQVLRPYVIETLVLMGRPVVAPLCEALISPDLPPVTKQQVSQILARIGYPVALPYLQSEISRKGTEGSTRTVLETAFNRIIERTGVPRGLAAAPLYLMLGENYFYRRESLILEPDAPQNLMWSYAKDAGLVATQIPTAVFPDVMAMRSARRALVLDRALASSLSLWIAANFRRENNLPDGATDPSYGADMQSPHFYATLAGPAHLQPVLQRALNDGDAELGLDAIRALAFTSDPNDLLNTEGDTHPLVAALNYPDRRIRYESAAAIARSVPRVQFAAAPRVVQVLAEAVREDGKRVAVVIAESQETVNEVGDLLRDVGEYKTLFGDSMEVVAQQVATAPGVDLIVVRMPTAAAQAAVAAARQHYKTMVTPVVVLTDATNVPTTRRLLSAFPGVFVTDSGAEKAQLTAAVKEAAAYPRGADISEEEALKYATTALAELDTIAVEAGETFQATDATPALLSALEDSRDDVVSAAAGVLARFSNAKMQQALADAAMNANRGAAMQVKLLSSLARSARINGNQLTEFQLRNLLELVSKATGPIADASAEAHGALNLPTANAVDLITK